MIEENPTPKALAALETRAGEMLVRAYALSGLIEAGCDEVNRMAKRTRFLGEDAA